MLEKSIIYRRQVLSPPLVPHVQAKMIDQACEALRIIFLKPNLTAFLPILSTHLIRRADFSFITLDFVCPREDFGLPD